jgi:hypothetical protein
MCIVLATETQSEIADWVHLRRMRANWLCLLLQSDHTFTEFPSFSRLSQLSKSAL